MRIIRVQPATLTRIPGATARSGFYLADGLTAFSHKRHRSPALKLRGSMYCNSCFNWYSVRSRIPETCRDCEAKQFALAAKEVESKSMSIASLSSWIVFKNKPVKFKAAYRIR